MSQDPPPPSKPERKPRRLWLTVGEAVAVAGLALAALGYWQGRQDRQEAKAEAAAQAAASAKAQVEAQRRSVFLMRGEVEAEGARVVLTPTDAGQVVQTQRYVFPSALLDHGKEIGAGRLQIDLVWFEDELAGALKAARKAGGELPAGEAVLPVGVVTTYVEDGETRVDRSLYRVGYVAQGGLLPGSVKLRLLGASLIRRGVGEDVQGAVDALWRDEAPR